MSDKQAKINKRHVPQALHRAIDEGWKPRGVNAPTTTLPCCCHCGRGLVVRASDITRTTGNRVTGYCCIQCRQAMARFLQRQRTTPAAELMDRDNLDEDEKWT